MLAQGGPHVAAAGALDDGDLGGDALPQVGDMADDADEPAAGAQVVQDVHDLLQAVGVEAAEALVDEQRIHGLTAGLGGDHVGESQRQGQRGLKGLPTGQGRGVPPAARPGVLDEQPEPGPAASVAAFTGVVDQGEPAAAHRRQPPARRGCDLLETGCEHKARQGHALAVLTSPHGYIGEAAHVLGGIAQRCHGRERRGEDRNEIEQASGPVAGTRSVGKGLLMGVPGAQRGGHMIGYRSRRVQVNGQLGAGQPGPHRNQVVPVGVQLRPGLGEPAFVPAGGPGGRRVREARGAGVAVRHGHRPTVFLLRQRRRGGSRVAFGVRVRELCDLTLTGCQLVGVPKLWWDARTRPGGSRPEFLSVGSGEVPGR